MTDSWITPLRDAATQATARNVALFSKLSDLRDRITYDLDRTLGRLGRVAEAREAADSQVHQRVVAALQSGHFQRLSIREQRHGATLFDDVPAAQMQTFLQTYPRNWRTFATTCFRRWGDFDRIAERAAYTRLLCTAPKDVKFLHHVIRTQDLVTSTGPATLARVIQAGDLIALRGALQQGGFEPTWSFTSRVIACWLEERVQLPDLFTRAWAALREDRMLEAMLLPPLPKDSGVSWFSSERRPVVRRSETVQAMVVAALIRAAYVAAHQAGGPHGWSEFSQNLLRSTFGDPRIPPESAGWVKVRSRDEPAYQRFLQELISEDIAVFFEHAMVDERRKEFWLGYLASLRRTVSVLDGNTQDRLRQRFAGADKRYAAAIARAKRFRKASCVQAFCLYFDSIVVVEFAETGNAAQIYDRAYFQQKFEPLLGTCNDHTSLKTPLSASGSRGVGERILHGGAWESKAEQTLEALGIVRDSGRRPQPRYR